LDDWTELVIVVVLIPALRPWMGGREGTRLLDLWRILIYHALYFFFLVETSGRGILKQEGLPDDERISFTIK